MKRLRGAGDGLTLEKDEDTPIPTLYDEAVLFRQNVCDLFPNWKGYCQAVSDALVICAAVIPSLAVLLSIPSAALTSSTVVRSCTGSVGPNTVTMELRIPAPALDGKAPALR